MKNKNFSGVYEGTLKIPVTSLGRVLRVHVSHCVGRSVTHHPFHCGVWEGSKTEYRGNERFTGRCHISGYKVPSLFRVVAPCATR